MSNQLKMADIQAILSLRAQRRSFREIARQLGVHRETVARYVRKAEAPSEPATALAGFESQVVSKPTTALTGSSRSVSQCEPWREVILTKASAGLTARRIWQDLRAEAGCGVSYYSVCRLVRKLSLATPLPMRRMECLPGEEAQVDFGSGAPIVAAGGKRRRAHVFRIVLSHSRKAYSEVCHPKRYSQSKTSFRIECDTLGIQSSIGARFRQHGRKSTRLLRKCSEFVRM